jgi:hypothetical protein
MLNHQSILTLYFSICRFLQVLHFPKGRKTPLTPSIHPQSRNFKPRPTLGTFRQQPQLMMLASIDTLQLPLNPMIR